MKIAIISDIHGNLAALKAVWKDMKRQKVDRCYCLGDIVGYGPYPKQCLCRVRRYASIIIQGNHEAAVATAKLSTDIMSELALRGAEYAARILGASDRDGLGRLPTTAYVENLGLSLAHGAFSEPRIWRYTDTSERAQAELALLRGRIGCLGHTHVPFVFGSEHGLYDAVPDRMPLPASERFLINVGSVGQPRDGDCRACYGIIDFNGPSVTFTLQRVFYRIDKTAEAIRKAGLPAQLAERLFQGA